MNASLIPFAAVPKPSFPSLTTLKDYPVDYAHKHALAMIRQREPQLHAWVKWIDDEMTNRLDDANTPLAGIPFGVKDVIDVAGMPTRCGSLASDDRPCLFHAASVELLIKAGAVPLGKTVTAEYAFRHPGPTCNPWNSAYTPGGSSSGSAAAVAAGMVPFALSTQTGGSIIRPAAYCGVPGFKPSYAALSRDGMKLTSESLDTLGWHAADMSWLEQCANILLPKPSSASIPHLSECRIALIRTVPDATLSPEGQVVLNSVANLLKLAGAQCVEIDALQILDQLAKAHSVIMKYEFARNLAPVIRQYEDRLSQSLRQNVLDGWNISHAQYSEMFALQYEMRTQWSVVSGGADYILTPPTAGAAPKGLDSTGTPAFNKCWTLLGWPCLHLPICRNTNGLPLGIQLIGPWHEDFAVISIGKQLESLIHSHSLAAH